MIKKDFKSKTETVDTVNPVGTVVFKCPSCRKANVVRIPFERKNCIKYRCDSCGFEGPN